MADINTLDEYKKALECFDWYYDYSDDHSVWCSGQRRLGELASAQKKFDPDQKIWKEVTSRRVTA